MLVPRNRLRRNPYFHFHPGHSLYSLVAVGILLAMMVWLILISPVGAR
ncbi:MAG TPA: hypothetical protein VFO39_00530 [Candidatus Sulfotelmatobacter sp.]|nr:hypothetical protein [Candidatus Sulfotelmatobacter sp.]